MATQPRRDEAALPPAITPDTPITRADADALRDIYTHALTEYGIAWDTYKRANRERRQAEIDYNRVRKQERVIERGIARDSANARCQELGQRVHEAGNAKDAAMDAWLQAEERLSAQRQQEREPFPPLGQMWV